MTRFLMRKLLIHCSALVFLLASSLFLIDADGTVRLVNDFDVATNKGRVEIYYDGDWGTICDDEWDILDADVVCRQLGFTGAIRALPRAYFGPGEDLIRADNVRCTGNEERIQDCPNAGWDTHNCVHLEDASVECSTASVRLVGGPDRYEGNVQVLDDDDNTWGYVCDDGWDDVDAHVACYQLDQRSSEYALFNSSYGTGDDAPFVLNNVDCDGYESTLQECQHGDWRNCTRFDKAGALCIRDYYEDGEVRLAGSGYPNRGRVEIYHNGEWGTVCDDFWDYYDAKVVCRQLGYSDSQPKAYYKSYFGPGQGRIWLDNLACIGSEERLEYCITSGGWGAHDCSHGEDAGVYCDERGEFDAAEITGIILASLFAASILFCCVKYICCEAASNKRHQRRRRSRIQRQRRRSQAAATRPTDPEEHFNAHFNDAYTISDNHDEIFTPPGFPLAYPGSAPPPFSPTDLPPAYETIMSTSTPEGSAVPVNSDETATSNCVDGNNVVNQAGPTPPQSIASVNTGTLPKPESRPNLPPVQPASSLPYPPPQPTSSNPYPPNPVMAHQQPPIPSNQSVVMPPVETITSPSTNQLGNDHELSSAPPPYTPRAPFEGQSQQPPAAPSPMNSVTVAESPATEETSVTFVNSAEESINLGLPDENGRLSDA
ncbi:scavenger receptor cysteine-rich type 1 protein M130-like [Lytechinus pictus]|uniref:scavenger receptor cysteine-rich type 1 protein M130-like n=1 Tax=Lytechinus pictus TaxID=7653 RepID=UPI0030B9DC92